jgi:Zn-dependent peptidase ImmA (M78 family)/transcriptional regulator with XRE-family HTH domain
LETGGVDVLGERIHRARALSGLTLREIAERAGVSHTAVARYEKDAMVPSSGVLLALARATGVRTEYFFRPDTPRLGSVDYRKRTRMAKHAQERVEQMVLDRAERFAELVGLFPTPPVLPFALPGALAKKLGSMDAVERAADDVRGAWALGSDAIADLRAVLEDRGVLVIELAIAMEEGFDGLLAMVGPYAVAAIGKDWPGDRQRFTLAHELGHLVLAGRLAPDLDEEKACNRFAGALLVPRTAAVQALGDHRRSVEPRELATLKREYGLSMFGWVYRAKELGILTDDAAARIFRSFSARGWRKNEPDPVAPLAPSRRFEQLVHRALSEDLIGESKAAELLGERLTDFRQRRRMELRGGLADHRL